MERDQVKPAELARRLGVRRSAVNSVLKGTGNLTLQTLAEYLGVLGYEVELAPIERGELVLSMRERRAPRLAQLTMRDADFGGAIAATETRERRMVPQIFHDAIDPSSPKPTADRRRNVRARLVAP
ncbi:helix-turn-helix domain-containing protein [Microbacterium aquimaris]